MAYRIFFIFLVSFSLICGQAVDDQIALEDYVTELKFVIIEEKVPAIINYLLNNSLTEHDISTEDIIKLSKLEKYTLEETIDAINFFNISLDKVFNVNSLEELLKSLNIKFKDFYNNLTTVLDINAKLQTEALDDLSIDGIEFFVALARDEYIYDILRDGIYNEEHVGEALGKIKKSKNDVYMAAKDFVLQKVLQLDSVEFMKILKDHGWNRQISLTLWYALNITTRDVYEVENFKQIFENITESLNQNLSIAVFTEKNQLTIHEKIYNQISNYVDGVTFKIQANQIEVMPRYDKRLGEYILAMTTKEETDKFIEITHNYTFVGNCSYVTIINHQVRVNEIEVDDNLIGTKNENIFFNLGSPLICDNQLYGLAKEETNNTIIFDNFYTREEIIQHEEENSNSDNGSTQLIQSVVLNLIMCFLLL